MTVTNAAGTAVKYVWVSAEGVHCEYGVIEDGASETIDTFVGHVWKFKDCSNDRAKTLLTITVS